MTSRRRPGSRLPSSRFDSDRGRGPWADTARTEGDLMRVQIRARVHGSLARTFGRDSSGFDDARREADLGMVALRRGDAAGAWGHSLRAGIRQRVSESLDSRLGPRARR